MHLFGRNFDHDCYFELPVKGERNALCLTNPLPATNYHFNWNNYLVHVGLPALA